MSVGKAQAVWNGNLREGNGTMRLGSSTSDMPYSYASRFEEGAGTNPEELIGAAHAGCFSMAFANILAKAGHTPRKISTTGKVALEEKDGGFWISSITLICEADVPGIDKDAFVRHAETAKENC